MDKWVVNNFVVQMRNSVTQARVQVLNKLVREIRKLENKKGTPEQKENNCRKSERFRKEVFFIKKLGADEISRFALVYPENPSEALTKGSLSLEERAKLRLVAHKSVALQVRIFRKKYPEWELKLPPLLVQLGLKNKYKKNKSSEQSENEKNKQDKIEIVKKDDLEAEEQTDKCVSNSLRAGNLTECTDIQDDEKKDDKQKTGQNKIVTRSFGTKNKNGGIAEVHRFVDLLEHNNDSDNSSENTHSPEEELDDSTNIVKDREVQAVKRVSNSLRAGNLTECTDIQDDDKKDDKQKTGQNKIVTRSFETKKKNGGIALVRRFVDLLEHDNDSDNSSENTHSPGEELDDATNIVNDPFFLTGDGSGESDEDTDANRGESRRKNTDDDGSYFSFRNRKEIFDLRKTEGDNRNNNFEKGHKREQQYSRDPNVPTMNRKQRRMMERARSEMKGNLRYTQHDFTRPKHFKPSVRKKHEHQQEQTELVSQIPSKPETLHPSWEAKRKLREQQIIVPFQGKKIKFDDDDD